METIEVKSPITFESRKQELQNSMNALLDGNDMAGAQKIFDKLLMLDNHKHSLKELFMVKDESYQRSILMADPIYKEAIDSGNEEIIEAFVTRKLTEEQYMKLMEQQYEKLFVAESPLNDEDIEEKKQMIDDILTTVNDMYKRFGEERGDMLTTQIMDFLSSSKGVKEFDLTYLQGISEKVHRYTNFMQKIIDNKVRLNIEKCNNEKLEKQRIFDDKMREKFQKTHEAYRQLNLIYDQIVEKEKILYQTLEDLCACTPISPYNGPDSSEIWNRANAKAYARLMMIPACNDGLPYSVPDTFVKYVQERGNKRGLELLEKSLVVTQEINDLQVQLSKRFKEVVGDITVDEEGNAYYANSSKVFTSSMIPTPINKMALRGMAGIGKGKKKKQ